MNEKDFKKGIEELKNIRMTEVEKERMLKAVFSSPLESPYMKRVPMFAFVKYQHIQAVLVSCFVILISFGGITYASGSSIPGDALYAVKVRVVEPVLDVVNRAPENKIVWEEEKVVRRIVEAEKLAERDELNDERVEELERKIERGSIAFGVAANTIASSTATPALSARERANDLKREFLKRINDRREIFNDEEDDQDDKIEIVATTSEKTLEEKDTDRERESSNERRADQKDKVRRLRDTAVRVLDNDDRSGDDRDDDDDDDRDR